MHTKRNVIKSADILINNPRARITINKAAPLPGAAIYSTGPACWGLCGHFRPRLLVAILAKGALTQFNAVEITGHELVCEGALVGIDDYVKTCDDIQNSPFVKV